MLCKKDNADKHPNASGTKEDVALDMACKHGCATEKDYPTWDDDDINDNKFTTPSEECIKNALRYKPTKKIKLDKINDILNAIDKNGGVVFKVKLYKEHVNVGVNGFMVQPKKGSIPSGSHEIYCGGYDLDLEKFMNGRIEKGFLWLYESYGTNRGYNGYVLVPIRYYVEKITGLYSSDTYFQTCYTVDTDEEFKYRYICDTLVPPIPKNEIILTVGSKIANVNGFDCDMGISPTVIQGRTYLPLRAIGDLLNVATRWYPSEKKITMYSKQLQMNIAMWLGKNKALVQDTINGTREIELLTTPICPNGSTLIGVRDCGNLFRMEVEYDSVNKKIKLEGLL